MNPYHKDTPRKLRARAMGEILSQAETVKDDLVLATRVREIAERVRQEEAAWKASLDEHGKPISE